MKFYAFLLLAFLSARAPAAPLCRSLFSESDLRLVTVEGVSDPSVQSRLRQQTEQTRAFYESVFGEVPGDIRIVADGPNALRTGYNFKDDSLQFPRLDRVKNNGFESSDVVNHELFHLFTCRRFPTLCPPDLASREELVKVHEALADYFAYKLHPDSFFGEDYYTDRPFLREYRTDMLLGLTSGPHAEAGVLVRLLIQNDISLMQIRQFLEAQPGEDSLRNLRDLSAEFRQGLQKELSYAMSDAVTGKAESKMRRYRLRPGETLRIQFSANAALKSDYPDLQIQFHREDGSESRSFQIESTDGSSFLLSLKPGAPAEKLLALFHSKGKILGARPFYLGPALAPSPVQAP